ncbi:MAG TPA: hypothetical protein PLW65_23005 [Pseudomonadota bacterium]|nr:hypothetical protein [Pseudomonadota bacterium]
MEKTEQQSLLEQYTARVQQRLKRVAELLLELRQDGGDGERLGELTSMFHNLAGSGGAYGFYELSLHHRLRAPAGAPGAAPAARRRSCIENARRRGTVTPIEVVVS